MKRKEEGREEVNQSSAGVDNVQGFICNLCSPPPSSLPLLPIVENSVLDFIYRQLYKYFQFLSRLNPQSNPMYNVLYQLKHFSELPIRIRYEHGITRFI
jgi:hypothetical protein